MYYALKTCDVLNILVPILYHLNDARADRSRVGLVHIGVFIILLLSGERNFGVRLNRPYLATVPMDLPIFSGTHADLLVIVFHKLITTGHQRLQPLFDCLLTILVNVSPYLKTLSMVASAKILNLLEAFSTPWFLFSNPTNHHLVFFLLEIFNNIIQYQFDGNSNLIYTIIRKRHIFHSLANLPTDYGSIQRSLNLAAKAVNLPPNSANSSLVTGGSGSSSGSVLRRSGSAKSATTTTQHRKLSRPLSLAEPSSSNSVRSSKIFYSNSNFAPNDHHYHHSQVMMSKSNPITPQTPNSTSANFDSVITTTDLASIQLESSLPFSTSSNIVNSPSFGTKNLLEDEPFNSNSGGSGSKNTTTNRMLMMEQSNNNMNVTLAVMPKLDIMTEKTHPNSRQTIQKQQQEDRSGESDEENEGEKKKTVASEFQHRRVITPISEIIKRDSGSAGYGGGSSGRHSSISRQSSSSASDQTTSAASISHGNIHPASVATNNNQLWAPTTEWILSWKQKLPLQTLMRMLQV